MRPAGCICPAVLCRIFIFKFFIFNWLEADQYAFASRPLGPVWIDPPPPNSEKTGPSVYPTSNLLTVQGKPGPALAVCSELLAGPLLELPAPETPHGSQGAPRQFTQNYPSRK